MMLEKIKNKKVLGIIVGISVVFLIAVITIIASKNPKKGEEYKNDALAGVFPEGNTLVEINLGTYYNEKQTEYCKIKLPGNYYGWAMYLAEDKSNKNFDMATSHFISDSVNNGILESPEKIQQFHYSNSQLVEDNTTDIYASIFNSEQITYDGMKSQISGATDIKEIGKNAFYSKGDEKYTEIDVTMYYKLADDITLEISYKGPLADKIGVDKVDKQLYELITLAK